MFRNPNFPQSLITSELQVNEHYVAHNADGSIEYSFTVVTKHDFFCHVRLDGETEIKSVFYEDLGLQVYDLAGIWNDEIYVTKD